MDTANKVKSFVWQLRNRLFPNFIPMLLWIFTNINKQCENDLAREPDINEV